MAAGDPCRPATPKPGPGSPAVVPPPPGRARRRVRRWAVPLVAVLLTALAGAWLLPGTVSGFDPAVWRAQADVDSNNRRFGMIRDLEAGKLRLGMTREEVHALLGPPELPWPSHDGWWLGTSLFGMDHEYYAVRYGPDGRVTGFGRVQG